VSEGEGLAKGPQPDHHDEQVDDSADEPYLITLPADRMRVDLSHLDVQRAAALFAELIYMTAGAAPRSDPRLISALLVVQDALGVSQDQYHVALADLLGIAVDAI
jgi:hypothetical protein